MRAPQSDRLDQAEPPTAWNIADVWEAVASAQPDALAMVHADRRVSWSAFDQRARSLAATLLRAGLGHQAKVAQLLYNCPEYIESVFAAFKVGMVPVNTNYRYRGDELVYLWDNADVEAVVFTGSLVDLVEAVRPRCPGIRLYLWVDDDGGECPSWATPYEAAATSGLDRAAPWPRSPDDLMLIYTGGTTGLPKGVMWRQDDLFAILNATAEVRYPRDGSAVDVAAVLAAPRRHPEPRLVPCPPLMHGSGCLTAFSVLNGGGCLILLASRTFDAVELLDVVEREQATEITIVGDAFARPILRALEAHPGRWDLSSLWLIISAGVMWSAEIKAGLLDHLPKVMLLDNLGSSEALSVGRSRSTASAPAATARFELSRNTRVIDEHGRDVAPGSGEIGMVALSGRCPVGYYKDPEKSAATFRAIGGRRWSVPGDFAMVEADGGVHLLGRGSVCINTGGEKVFPEEVEEALKRHPLVDDAVVVGVPDERFGEMVVGIVETAADLDDTHALVAHVKERLAGYKAPKHILTVRSLGRAANGKADYRRWRDAAILSLTAQGAQP